MTLQEFIDDAGITLTSEYADSNPHMENSDRMDNYKVRLRRSNGQICRKCGYAGPCSTCPKCVIRTAAKTETMRLYYSKGVGHNGARPTADEVLDCLAMDASGIDNARDFADWCNEYGHDTDSRRVEKIYKVCQRQAERLRKFLGDERYQMLLWEIERQ